GIPRRSEWLAEGNPAMPNVQSQLAWGSALPPLMAILCGVVLALRALSPGRDFCRLLPSSAHDSDWIDRAGPGNAADVWRRTNRTGTVFLPNSVTADRAKIHADKTIREVILTSSTTRQPITLQPSRRRQPNTIGPWHGTDQRLCGPAGYPGPLR